MFRLFRLEIDFPALNQFTEVLNRFLDFQESNQQKEIDELAARLRASTAELKDSVDTNQETK